MKRIILEVLLVLGLAGSGYFGWTQRAGYEALQPQVTELTEKVDESTKAIEAAEEEELPETVLCNSQIHALNLEDCPQLPPFDMDEDSGLKI